MPRRQQSVKTEPPRRSYIKTSMFGRATLNKEPLHRNINAETGNRLSDLFQLESEAHRHRARGEGALVGWRQELRIRWSGKRDPGSQPWSQGEGRGDLEEGRGAAREQALRAAPTHFSSFRWNRSALPPGLLSHRLPWAAGRCSIFFPERSLCFPFRSNTIPNAFCSVR